MHIAFSLGKIEASKLGLRIQGRLIIDAPKNDEWDE